MNWRNGLLYLLITATAFAAPSCRERVDGWNPQILEKNSPVYLPDYSYAGYRWGEVALPRFTGAVIAATDYGAIPDDGRDDTQALRAALEAARRTSGPVVVELPKGRLQLKEILWIKRGYIALRGAGSGEDGTVIFAPGSMVGMELPTELESARQEFIAADKSQANKPFSPFSWRGGMIWTKKEDRANQRLAGVVRTKRGSHEVTVDKAVDLAPGEVVEVRWYNKEGPRSSFLDHLFDGARVQLGERLYDYPHMPLVQQALTVSAVSGSTVTFKEPLMHDARPEWKSDLYRVDYLEEVHIEGLRFEFPDTVYGGHHQEAGYNALYLYDLLHSTVRDVTVVNGDAALLSDGCKNVTVTGLRTEGRLGHYSIHFGSCSYMLATDFRLSAPALHSPSFNTRSILNVFSGGEINDARIDQHCGINHQNLFDDIRIRKTNVKDLFHRGGSRSWWPTAGAFNTFWNVDVEFEEGDAIDPVVNAPSARLVAIYGTKALPVLEYTPQAYIEGYNKQDIAIPSLYRYQLEKRLE